MGLLDGKKALVFGVANKDSIAWGITKALHREGATIGLSYAMEALERRVRPLAEDLGIDFVERCDVRDDAELDSYFEKAKARFESIDILVHSIAYAQREDLQDQYVSTSREGFGVAMEVSVFSLVALTQRALPMMNSGGSVIAMTFYGSEKAIPRYNVMGVAKAALEASVRYLSVDLGKQGMRVNAISAGPIKTLSAKGIGGFGNLARTAERASPLHQLVSQDDVGNAAVWLASDWGAKVTGQVVYVDAGASTIGAYVPEEFV